MISFCHLAKGMGPLSSVNKAVIFRHWHSKRMDNKKLFWLNFIELLDINY